MQRQSGPPPFDEGIYYACWFPGGHCGILFKLNGEIIGSWGNVGNRKNIVEHFALPPAGPDPAAHQ